MLRPELKAKASLFLGDAFGNNTLARLVGTLPYNRILTLLRSQNSARRCDRKVNPAGMCIGRSGSENQNEVRDDSTEETRRT